MDVVDALEVLATGGVPVLKALATGRVTREGVAVWQGATVAGRWERLAGVYFGPTRFRKLQSAAVAAARDGGLPIAALEVIDKHTRKLLKGAAVTEWELRVELCGLRGGVDDIDQVAAARVRELNRRVSDAAKKAWGMRSLKGGKNTDAAGMRTITVTLPEREMVDLLTPLQQTTATLRAKDERLSYEQGMVDALMQHLTGGAGPVTPATFTPLVVIGLPDWAKLLRHEGDESVFALTDGTTMTGAELVAARMAEHHLVGLYDPVAGPVNLYRQSRFANTKQRLLLSAETILCPQPGCTTSADQCQVHHLKAWRFGGETNLVNMSMACPVHNGRNDDDPNAPPRNGRLVREPGGVVQHPPDGGPPRRNMHPIRGLSAMALIQD